MPSLKQSVSGLSLHIETANLYKKRLSQKEYSLNSIHEDIKKKEREAKKVTLEMARLLSLGEISEEYIERQLKQIKEHPDVRLVFFVENCLRVRTKVIYIKMPYWEKRRKAGIFDILIPFEEGSKILIKNITHTHEGIYDSPTIKRAEPCWGNIGDDISNDLYFFEFYELIKDIIDFLKSTQVSNGYLAYDGELEDEYDSSDMAWDAFFSSLEKHPPGYSIEKYLNKEEVEKIEDIPEGRLIADFSGFSNLQERLLNHYTATAWDETNTYSSILHARRYRHCFSACEVEEEDGVDVFVYSFSLRYGINDRANVSYLKYLLGSLLKIKEEMSVSESLSIWDKIKNQITSTDSRVFSFLKFSLLPEDTLFRLKVETEYGLFYTRLVHKDDVVL